MRLIGILFIFFFVFACQHKERYDLNGGDMVELEDGLKKTLEEYINHDPCLNCIYEVYIDKKAPDYYQVMLYKGYNSLTFQEYSLKKKYPLLYTYVLNKKVYIYSGAENYFFNKTPLIVQKRKNRTDRKFNVWVFSDSLGIKKIDTFNQAYPFFHLPVKMNFNRPY